MTAQALRRRRSWRTNLCSCAADLITDFLNADVTNAIQERDDIAMQRLFVRANRNFHARICRIKLLKRRLYLVIGNVLPINISSITAGQLQVHDSRIGRLHLSYGRW